MPRSIIRTITLAIAIAALAAPTALATDTPSSLAAKAAAAEQEQHAHSPAARLGMYTPGATRAVTYTAATNAQTAQPQLAPPTWPTDPEPISTALAGNASH